VSTVSEETDAYVLGTDQRELDRLRQQHEAWVGEAQSLLERAGLRSGQTVLDLGCGPGSTTVQLARVVGPQGQVIARDVSPGYIAHLRSELERLGIDHVRPSLGPVEELQLADGSLDAAYSRWLFCWLPDAAAVLSAVARALRPGGVMICQEYFNWASMKLVPRDGAHDRVVAACMASWQDSGTTIDIAEQLPTLAAQCGLTVEYAAPVARLGRPGSLVWTWLSEFYDSYLPRVVERGLLDEDTRLACLDELQRRQRENLGFIAAPTMLDLVLRKA
jgi:ubiquinone/menaquinone biosynthesis C-methylase UbiE